MSTKLTNEDFNRTIYPEGVAPAGFDLGSWVRGIVCGDMLVEAIRIQGSFDYIE
jgi:hypothetical protein